jgi:hypothetical protein
MCRDPLRCIVPPYVLTYLVEHGKDTERARELKTLTTDFDARAARIQNAKQRAMGPLEGADVLATIDPPGPNRIIRNADHHWSVTLVRVSGVRVPPPASRKPAVARQATRAVAR